MTEDYKYDFTDLRTRFKPKKVTTVRYVVVEELTGDEIITQPVSYGEALKIADAANHDLQQKRIERARRRREKGRA